MKNFLFPLIISLVYISNASAGQALQPCKNPVCKPAMEHMMANYKQLESAIAANDVNAVGKLVIANHQWLDAFFTKNPECKPKHEMGGCMMANQNSMNSGGCMNQKATKALKISSSQTQ